MCQTLEELGHPQPRTPIQTDNSTAHALLTNKIILKALKAKGMILRWLKCREEQEQFQYYWRLGTQNLADYFTKHHPPSHHIAVLHTLLTPTNDQIHQTLWENKRRKTQKAKQYNIVYKTAIKYASVQTMTATSA